ncbi:MAG: hypothetical protein KatS3mg076_2538 [Candidatus Binatia bacterium]|nr:MAG: hypothetical protein KatS3mg076_2538 [Candidatus Binatia bacterium]
MAVAPNLGAAYVTLPSSGSVVLVDTRRHEVRRTVPVGGEPFGVAVTPDTKTVLVAGCAPEDGTVGLCFLDTGTADVEAFLPLGGALAVGVRPDGKFAYVSGCQGGTCVVDLGQREVVGSLPGVGEDAVSLAFLRDGSEVFLPTPSGGKLFRVDSRAHEVVAEITGFTAPVCVALGPAGRRAYVTDPEAARVRVVDVPTGNIAGGISTPGRRPYCVAVAPSLCPGDCDGDGAVDTEEFELVTSFLFDTTLLSLCPESDRDADLRVSAHEVVAALLALAEGCAS